MILPGHCGRDVFCRGLVARGIHIDNQILHSVLKGFISVFTEMHLDGVSDIPQLSLETVGLLLVFGFCHILCSFT